MLNKNVHFLFYSLTYSLISISNCHLFSIEGNDPCVTYNRQSQDRQVKNKLKKYCIYRQKTVQGNK